MSNSPGNREKNCTGYSTRYRAGYRAETPAGYSTRNSPDISADYCPITPEDNWRDNSPNRTTAAAFGLTSMECGHILLPMDVGFTPALKRIQARSATKRAAASSGVL